MARPNHCRESVPQAHPHRGVLTDVPWRAAWRCAFPRRPRSPEMVPRCVSAYALRSRRCRDSRRSPSALTFHRLSAPGRVGWRFVLPARVQSGTAISLMHGRRPPRTCAVDPRSMRAGRRVPTGAASVKASGTGFRVRGLTMSEHNARSRDVGSLSPLRGIARRYGRQCT